MNTRPIIKFFKKNSGTILAILASGGVVATSIFSGKAAIKAHEKLKEAQKEADHELTNVEKIKTVATTYITPILFGASTIACIFGINILDNKKYASLACAYGMLRGTYNKYKDKVIERHGMDEHVEITKEIAPKNISVERANAPYLYSEGIVGPSTTCGIEDPNEEIRLFYLVDDERYFEAKLSNVLNAMYHLNRNMALAGEVDANMWYDFLGIEPTEGRDNLVWYANDAYVWIDFDMKEVELEDGLKCIYIEAVWGPDTPENIEIYLNNC